MRTVFVMLLVACRAPDSQPGDQVDASSGAGGDSGAMNDASVSTGTCDGKTTQPLDATWMIQVGSANRVARVHVPASYDPSKRTPLLIDVHGRTQNASGQMTLSKSKDKAD